MNGPLLWYVNRGSGLVLLVVFTLTVVLGVLATGNGRRLWPRFVTQGLHRGLSLVSAALLLGHVLSAVVDDYVDIRWWQALVPFGATYRPLYLGLGTLALDITVAVALTSLVRTRLGPAVWRAVHLTSYLAWAVAVVHTVGIGTDAADPFGRVVVAACAGAVLVAATARVAMVSRRARPA
ncbi:MAG TPA: ferric reductase-like transmembrane domain-containing protein [Dermatophilaceae bacterium]|nr:ferric reductase-like transmembrane domain-containing protein [Dermatophilaceae bacterium]